MFLYNKWLYLKINVSYYKFYLSIPNLVCRENINLPNVTPPPISNLVQGQIPNVPCRVANHGCLLQWNLLFYRVLHCSFYPCSCNFYVSWNIKFQYLFCISCKSSRTPPYVIRKASVEWWIPINRLISVPYWSSPFDPLCRLLMEGVNSKDSTCHEPINSVVTILVNNVDKTCSTKTCSIFQIK
jgi:hypothetical protein